MLSQEAAGPHSHRRGLPDASGHNLGDKAPDMAKSALEDVAQLFYWPLRLAEEAHPLGAKLTDGS